MEERTFSAVLFVFSDSIASLVCSTFCCQPTKQEYGPSPLSAHGARCSPGGAEGFTQMQFSCTNCYCQEKGLVQIKTQSMIAVILKYAQTQNQGSGLLPLTQCLPSVLLSLWTNLMQIHPYGLVNRCWKGLGHFQMTSQTMRGMEVFNDPFIPVSSFFPLHNNKLVL